MNDKNLIRDMVPHFVKGFLIGILIVVLVSCI